MRKAVVLVLVGVLSLGACGGDADDAADTSAASTTARRGEQIVIRTRMIIAAEEGAEPIATGEVLDRSTIGDSPFCAGGTVLDFEGLRGSGEIEVVYDPDAAAPAHVTLTGTVTR